MSPSVRRAWVEICPGARKERNCPVALHAKGVGRNTSDTLRKYFRNSSSSTSCGVEKTTAQYCLRAAKEERAFALSSLLSPMLLFHFTTSGKRHTDFSKRLELSGNWCYNGRKQIRKPLLCGSVQKRRFYLCDFLCFNRFSPSHRRMLSSRSTGILIRRTSGNCSCWDFCRRMSGEKNPSWLH